MQLQGRIDDIKSAAQGLKGSELDDTLRLAAASGMRSTLGPTILAERRGKEPAKILRVLAGAELVADKLPFIPSRLWWPIMSERAIAGALVGWGAYSSRSRQDRIIGAVTGAAVAVAVGALAAQVRTVLKRRLKIPYAVSGLAEDALALKLALR